MKNEIDPSELNYKDLKDRLNKESLQSQFRTQRLGGFNQEDVTNYILKIEDMYKKLEKDLNAERKKSKNYQEKLEQETEEREKLQSRLNDYIINRRSDYSNSFAVNQDTPPEIAELMQGIQQLEEENSQLKDRIRKLESGISSEAVQNDGISQYYEELTQQLEYERSRNRSLDSDLQSGKEEIIRLQEELAAEKDLLKEKKQIIEQFESDSKRQERNSRIEQDKLLDSLRKFDEESFHLKTRIRELEELAAANEEKQEEAVKICNDLRQQLEYEKKRFEDQRLLIEEDEQLFEKLINEARDELEKAREQASSMREENRNLKWKVMDLEKAVSLHEIKSHHARREQPAPGQREPAASEAYPAAPPAAYTPAQPAPVYSQPAPAVPSAPVNNYAPAPPAVPAPTQEDLDLIRQIKQEFERALKDMEKDSNRKTKIREEEKKREIEAGEKKEGPMKSKDASTCERNETIPSAEDKKKSPGQDRRTSDRLNRIL